MKNKVAPSSQPHIDLSTVGNFRVDYSFPVYVLPFSANTKCQYLFFYLFISIIFSFILFFFTFDPLVIASEKHGCYNLENDDIKQKIVIVKRGLCTIYEKSLYIQSLGGYGVIIGNTFDNLQNINIDDVEDNQIRIPIVIISKSSYERIMVLKTSSYKIFNDNMKIRFMIGRCLPFDSELVFYIIIIFFYYLAFCFRK